VFPIQIVKEFARNVWNYFKAVETKWPTAWGKTARGNILNRTTGFAALMRFLRPVYSQMNGQKGVVPVEHFSTVFGRIRIAQSGFTPTNYKPGTSGESRLYRDLMDEAGIEEEI
jgi:hypothetical protein